MTITEIIKIKGPYGVKDLRTGKVYSEAIIYKENEKYYRKLTKKEAK